MWQNSLAFGKKISDSKYFTIYILFASSCLRSADFILISLCLSRPFVIFVRLSLERKPYDLFITHGL